MKLYLMHILGTYLAIGFLFANYALVREWDGLVREARMYRKLRYKARIVLRAVGVYLILPLIWGYLVAKLAIEEIG